MKHVHCMMLAVAVAIFASCAGTTPVQDPSSEREVRITVLTSAGCGQTDLAVERVRTIAARLGIGLSIDRVLVASSEDAKRLHFLGSPTLLVDDRDLDPSARERTDFGLGWRSYGTSAVPPEDMIEHALREALASTHQTIVVRASGFGWGAVAGLGWGSRLAPVLAQLEAVGGIREARVDWTGQSFLLTLDASARPEDVIAATKTILGPTAQRLHSPEEQEQIATFKAGAPWLRAGETARMSAREARVLAQRYATDAARNAGLDEERSGRLIALVQDELEKLFRGFERTGLPSRDVMTSEWKGLADRVAERSRAFLTDTELDRVAEYLRECCSR